MTDKLEAKYSNFQIFIAFFISSLIIFSGLAILVLGIHPPSFEDIGGVITENKTATADYYELTNSELEIWKFCNEIGSIPEINQTRTECFINNQRIPTDSYTEYLEKYGKRRNWAVKSSITIDFSNATIGQVVSYQFGQIFSLFGTIEAKDIGYIIGVIIIIFGLFSVLMGDVLLFENKEYYQKQYDTKEGFDS